MSCVLQSWPEDALQAVASRFLEDVEMTDESREGCINMCKSFHTSTITLSERFLSELQRHNYVTPTSYLELISTFRTLLENKRAYGSFHLLSSLHLFHLLSSLYLFHLLSCLHLFHLLSSLYLFHLLSTSLLSTPVPPSFLYTPLSPSLNFSPLYTSFTFSAIPVYKSLNHACILHDYD